MAASVRAVSSVNFASATSVSVTKPTGTVENDVLVVAISFSANSLAAGPVTLPSGWAVVTGLTNPKTSGGNCALFAYKVAGGSEPSSYSFSWTDATSGAYGCWAVQDANTSSPIDAAAEFSEGTLETGHDGPTVSPAGTNSLLLVAACANNPGSGNTVSYTTPSGMTEDFDIGGTNRAGVGGFSLALSSSGATGTKTATCAHAIEYVAFSVAIASASSTQTVTANLLAAATAVHTPSTAGGTQAVLTNHLAAATALHNPTVSGGGADIAMSALTSGNTSTNAASYTTDSITPTPNALVFAAILNTDGTLPSTLSLSGCGLTWEQIDSQTFNTLADPNHRLSLFRAMGASPTTGPVTIDAGAGSGNQSGCAWSIVEFTGADTSGTNGSGAIVQSLGSASTDAASMTITLDAFGSVNNVTFGCFANNDGTAPTVGAGFTQIHSKTFATPDGQLLTEWVDGNDISVNSTQGAAASPKWGGIAVEIKAVASASQTVVANLLSPATQVHTPTIDLGTVHASHVASSGQVFNPSIVSAGDGTWQWSSSLLDGLGRSTCSTNTGGRFYVGGDVSGVHVSDDEGAGTLSSWGAGLAVHPDTGVIEGALRKITALAADTTKVVALLGEPVSGGTGTGGIAYRGLDDEEWTIATTSFYGNMGGGTSVRPIGRRIALATIGSTEYVWVSAYRSSTPRQGIARSTTGGASFSAWSFDLGNATLGREYTALFVSPQFLTANSAVLYASAPDDAGAGTEGVFVIKNADTSSPTFVRIDNAGTGNPGGLTDVRDLAVVNEDGDDVLYLVNGTGDATSANRGVWRCVIGDPTASGWVAGNVSWSQRNTGIDTAANWTSIVAKIGSETETVTTQGNPSASPRTSGNPVVFTNPAFTTKTGDTADPWGVGWDPDTALNSGQQKPAQQGRVDVIFRSGSYVYIGGQFHRARNSSGSFIGDPDDSSTVRHLVRVNAETGVLDSTWLPDLVSDRETYDSARVWDITAFDPGDDQGTRLLVAGQFTSIDGTSVNGVAAFNIDGAPELDTDLLNLNFNDRCTAVAVDGTNIYVGGHFTTVGSSTRRRLAKLTLSGSSYILDSTWMAGSTSGLSATEGSVAVGDRRWVQRIFPLPGHDRVVICGPWTSINGRPDTEQKYIAAVNKTNGQLVSWADPIRQGTVFITGMAVGNDYPIIAAALDGTDIYTGSGGTNLAAKWNGVTGAKEWHWFTNGGVQAACVLGDRVYFGFHGSNVSKTSGGSKPSSWTATNSEPRLGLWAVSTDGGTLHSYAPSFDGSGGNGNEGNLKVWALEGSGHLYVGGDFMRAGGSALPKFALFPATSSSSSSSSTYLLAGCFTPTPELSGTFNDWTGVARAYAVSHARSLDSGANWDVITDESNVDMTVYGTTETWALQTVPNITSNRARLGGTRYRTDMLSLDTDRDLVVSSGYGGTWICVNPWDSDETAVQWQPFVSGFGAMGVRSVVVDDTNNNRVLATGDDLEVFRWTDGGDGQPDDNYDDDMSSDGASGGIRPSSMFYDPRGVVVAARTQGSTNPNSVVGVNSDPWSSVCVRGTGGCTNTFNLLPSTGGDQLGVIRWESSTGSRDVILVATVTGGVQRSVDGGSFATTSISPYTITSSADDQAGQKFVATNGSDRCWFLNNHATAANGGGLWLWSEATTTWTRIWQKTNGTSLIRHVGRIAQDPTTETTLYVTFGDGVWKITNAHNGTLNDDGTTATGTIAATQYLSSRKTGAIAVDPTNGDIVVCITADDAAGADILLSSNGGTTWTSIADETYVETAYLPLDVKKVGNNIYVSLSDNGIIKATLQGGVIAELLTNATTVHDPTIVQVVAMSNITSTATVPNPTVTQPLTTTVTANYLSSGTTLYSPSVSHSLTPYPTVEVRISFTDLGSEPVWTDVTGYVREVSVNRGRQRDLDQIQAGTASLRLDNRDRRFDPDNTASPYYPNVVPLRRIQILGTYNSLRYPVFTGFIETWPQEWEGAGANGVGDAYTTIEATDAFTVLSGVNLPSSVYELEVRADTPTVWYRLSDETSSNTAVDESGNAHDGAYVGGAVTKGTGGAIAGEANNAVTFDGGSVQAPLTASFSGTGAFTVECWVNFSDVHDGYIASQDASNLLDANPGRNWSLRVTSGSQLVWQVGGTSCSGQVLYDDWAHLVAIRLATGGLRLYLNNALLASTTSAQDLILAHLPSNINGDHIIRVGANYRVAGDGDPFYGIIDEFAFYSSAMSTTRIAAHHTAANDPWEDDLTGTRVGRVLDLIGWATADRDVDAGSSTLQTAVLGGESALTFLQQIEETENGLFFVQADGNLKFRERHAILQSPYTSSQATFGDGAGEFPYYDLVITSSYDLIRNEIKVTRDGGIAQVARDSTSQTKYKVRSFERSGLQHNSDNESRDAAHWILSHYKDPIVRIDSMEIRPQRDATNVFPQVLDREIGDRITIRRRPPGGGSAIARDVHIEGISHNFRPGIWETTWHLSPAEAQSYFIWGTSQWDTDTRWAY
jgi:hypothetical protein